MTKILYFILLFLAVIGLLGGIGYTIYYGAYVVTIGIAVLGYLAYPSFIDYFNELKN